MVLCCCALVPLTICGCFCGFYWSMLTEAMDYNDLKKVPDSDILAYDNCGFYTAPVPQSDGTLLAPDIFNSKWMVFLHFNSYLYLSLGISVILMLLGTFFMPLWCCGCCGGICGGLAHLACIIVTGVFRFNKEGEKCAEQEVAINDDVTFKDHGETIMALYISQCVLYIVLGICMGCITGFAGQLGGAQCAVTMGKFAR